ncbi:MAG: flagellar hook-basal body complex protein [Planctomycetota bacterium]|nr:MAG: flagellar hook-basal body complex protein [Planctomycetota bacterium]
MLRALDSGVSGMLSNQLALDVTSNNLANVNTPGFKGSRVTFATRMIQTEFSGSGAGNNVGGQNPRQVGLGVDGASVEVNMGQGSLQSTGRALDLAVQGSGFFQVTDGNNTFFTRVGNFGMDESNNLIHLSTGFRVVGNVYGSDVDENGNQQIIDQGVPLQMDLESAIPPQQTGTIDFQGNLDPSTPAMRGNNLRSIFSLTNSETNSRATGDTLLRDLNIFSGDIQPPSQASGDPDDDIITMHIFGTKPNGEAYASSFSINPWEDTTANLVDRMNGAFSQGGNRFATARLQNGSLTFNSTGGGDGFSVFFGEQNPINALSAVDSQAYEIPDPNPEVTIAADDAGLLNPSIDGTINDDISISVRINGVDRGTVMIPAGTYDAANPSPSLRSLPYVNVGDEVEYVISGDNGETFDLISNVYRDSNPANLTGDTNGDGIPDMFQEHGADAHAWQYQDDTNGTFDWYRTRAVPDSVSSSIEVYDSQGGRHSVEARYFRVGTRTDQETGAKITAWDMMINVNPSRGEMVNDMVAGIEFDQEGRFIGINSGSVYGGDLADPTVGYVEGITDQSIQVNWTTTGPTNPSEIDINLGTLGGFNGLTSFGSASTAGAVSQDGYSDGRVDSISVTGQGDVVALYTNGISRKLVQLPLTTFRNPEGLTAMADNLWGRSTASGEPSPPRTPGEGAGVITSSALEGSNVDIANEFTKMITSQRGFQVSARVIQTTDRILEELTNLTR